MCSITYPNNSHPFLVFQFTKIKAEYTANERLRLFLDTSFDAAGRKSGYLITTLSMEHPFVTRARSGEDQTGVTVPLAAMAHQRRDGVTHQELIVVADQLYKFAALPNGTTLVSDREFRDTRVWDNCKKVMCWNHLKDNLARAARRITHCDRNAQTQLKDELHLILMSTTEDSYDNRIGRYFYEDGVGHEVWKNAQFQQYYTDHLDQDIRRFSGRWVLREADIPNPEKGITNNRAESMNRMFNQIKDLKTKGGLPYYTLLFAMY